MVAFSVINIYEILSLRLLLTATAVSLSLALSVCQKSAFHIQDFLVDSRRQLIPVNPRLWGNIEALASLSSVPPALQTIHV